MFREKAPDGSTRLTGMSLSDILLAVHPVGSYYTSEDSTNPGTIFGGTWVRVKGKVLVGVDEADAAFDTVGETGGEKTHTLTVAEMPSHGHNNTISTSVSTGGSNFYMPKGGGGTLTAGQSQTPVAVSTNGGGEPHNNLQPYVTCYMWKRTA